MKLSKFVCCFFVLFTLFGCSSQGNAKLSKLDDKSGNDLINNIHTKEDAFKTLGEPNDQDFDTNGNQKWTYSLVEGKMKASSFIPIVDMFNSGVDQDKKKIVFVFNSQGEVIGRLFVTSKDEMNTSLIK